MPSKKAILEYLKRKRRRIGRQPAGRLSLELTHGEYVSFNVNADEDAEVQMVVSVGSLKIFLGMMLPEAKTLRRKLDLAIKDREEERKYLRVTSKNSYAKPENSTQK